jgi:hypothetical protein
MVCVSFLVTVAPRRSFIPMNGTRKSSPPPAVLLATTSRISRTEATRRSAVVEARDTPARLIESLTTLISVSTGTPSSVTFTASPS